MSLLNNKMGFADKINVITSLSTIQKFRRGVCLGCVIYVILLKGVRFNADLVLVGESEKDTAIVLSVVSSVFRFLKSDKIPQEDKDILVSQTERLLERYKEME